ncbi:MAG: type I methionyl aminopeptidase [Actinomycetota bacterium]|nr:type I methionyl aminopeptidase [Actinomycetota bacterium]
MAKRKRRRPAMRQPRHSANPVTAGTVSPTRLVPEDIARPDYAAAGVPIRKAPADVRKDDAALERMRTAGAAARRVLREVAAEVAPGVTTDHLDAICHEACIAEGGYPSPLNYNGYPKSLCTSVNEIICHGIPDSRALAEGDIVNCDVTIFLNGVHGDHSETFAVGTIDQRSEELIRVTRECLYLGIGAVRSGGIVSDIGKAIQTHAESAGFGVVREFIGHGVGEVFHHQPNIPHYYEPSARFQFVSGMTFTIEPMITIGSPRAHLWEDGWTAATADLSRTAQFEHTVLVRDDGVEILTVEDDEAQPFLPNGDPDTWPSTIPLDQSGFKA